MMPVVFFGHGSPLNAIASNPWTRAWGEFGRANPVPRAVLCISAHWYVPATRVTAMPAPRTIHDFSGFPRELHQVRYPAPGAPELAAQVQELLAPAVVAADRDWGLDHGSWSVLCHVFPRADVPVVQLSIDATRPARYHFELGQRLAPLREQGILIAGSGGLVHHLGRFVPGDPPAQEWALRAEQGLEQRLLAGAVAELVDYERLGEDIMTGIPTPDHYLPLLYVLGAAGADASAILCRGIEGGSISLLSVRFDRQSPATIQEAK
jgi:4,5-DOPA dioxygenase extradiol